MDNYINEKIFNGTPEKRLFNEYNNLKKDYTKMNAIKYKALYENASLSFILENSRYIFSEPIRGYDFYKNIMESQTIPFHMIENEADKISNYISENTKKMSDEQKDMYHTLYECVYNKYNNMKNSVNLYTYMMENVNGISSLYDALYEYKKTGNDSKLISECINLFESEDINLMDAINVVSEVDELSSNLYEYVSSAYNETINTPDECALNTYTSNVLRRMMSDSYIKEKVSNISNMNTRHLIQGIAFTNDVEYLESVSTEVVKNYDPIFSTAENSINKVYESMLFDSEYSDITFKEKKNILACEKAIIDTNLSFAIIDYYTNDKSMRNSIIEKICIESTEIEKIPQDTYSVIEMLEKESKSLEEELMRIDESLSSDGTINPVISDRLSKLANPSEPIYNGMSNDVSDDAIANLKNKNKKNDNVDTNNDEPIEEKHDDIAKPEKRNIFQRVQNKALDANVQFKKKVAEAKRKSVDAKNAGKAVSKIPENVTSSIKSQINEWDTMDDNKRKEYILKPGIRKKYFRALKLCIYHGALFAVNPVLNIVLFIATKLGHSKDERIRNEVLTELESEIKVTEEKIEDARRREDDKQKYQLMRIRDKLQAEVVRVSSNSKVI